MDLIFFHQIRDRLAFLAIHPASQDGQHDLESGRVDNGRSLHQGSKPYRCRDPVVGHYASKKGECAVHVR